MGKNYIPEIAGALGVDIGEWFGLVLDDGEETPEDLSTLYMEVEE